MAHQPGLYHKLVLIDQSQLRQPRRELHASQEQSLTRFLLELLDGLPQLPAHELRVPINPVQGARHNVLLRRVDRPGEGFHPIGPRSRPRRRPKRCLHHFISHPAKKEGIGPVEVLDRVTMQLFVRDNCTVIAAPVQRDVDRIPKGSHYVRVPIATGFEPPPCWVISPRQLGLEVSCAVDASFNARLKCHTSQMGRKSPTDSSPVRRSRKPYPCP